MSFKIELSKNQGAPPDPALANAPLQNQAAVQQQQQAPQQEQTAQQQRQAWSRAHSAMNREYRETAVARAASELQVRMPQQSVSQEYAEVGKETISAGKRSTRSHMLGSALRRKRINREMVQRAEQETESRQKIYETRKQDVFGNQQEEGAYSPELQNMLAPLLTEEDAGREDLPADPTDLMLEKISAFMDMKLDLHMESDEQFAAQIGQINQMMETCRAMTGIKTYMSSSRYELELRRRWEEDGDEDARDKFEMCSQFGMKLNLAEQVSKYCGARKALITNPYYQTHYNSELSYRYREDAPPAAKYVTQLIRAVEYLKNEVRHAAGLKSGADVPPIVSEQESAMHSNLRAALWKKVRMSDGQIQNSYSIMNHASYSIAEERSKDFLADTLQNDSVMQTRLSKDDYRVTGMKATLKEPLERGGHLLLSTPVFARMPAALFKDMINNLGSTPAPDAGEEEQKACQQKNLQGMRELKLQTRIHVQNLMRKYGLGLTVMPLEQIAENAQQIANDLAFNQTAENVLEMMRSLQREMPDADPPLFDEVDEELMSFHQYFMSTANLWLTGVTGYAGAEHCNARGANLDQTMGNALKMTAAQVPQIEGMRQDLEIDWNQNKGFPLNPNAIIQEILRLSPESIQSRLSDRGKTKEEISGMVSSGELRWNQLDSAPIVAPVEMLIDIVGSHVGAGVGKCDQLTNEKKSASDDHSDIVADLEEVMDVKWADKDKFTAAIDKFRSSDAQKRGEHPELALRWQEFSERARWYSSAVDTVFWMKDKVSVEEAPDAASALVRKSFREDLDRVEQHFREEAARFITTGGAQLIQDSEGIF